MKGLEMQGRERRRWIGLSEKRWNIMSRLLYQFRRIIVRFVSTVDAVEVALGCSCGISFHFISLYFTFFLPS